MDIKSSSKFLAFITMVDLLKYNIIEKIPFSVYLEIPCITFKTEKSFIAHPWIQRPVVGMVSRYSTVRSGTLTWREWGLCLKWNIPGELGWYHVSNTSSQGISSNGIAYMGYIHPYIFHKEEYQLPVPYQICHITEHGNSLCFLK